MIRLSVIFLYITMHTVIYSQNSFNLWEGEAPYNKKGVSVEEVNINNRFSKISVPQLYHYASTIESETKKPAIIIAPGGSYSGEVFNHEGFMVAEWFADQGVEAFILKYRLPDQELVDNFSFVPLMDAQEAIAWVRSNAKEYNIDDQNIGIIGFSAGGHLAASASTLFKEPVNTMRTSKEVRPDFSILIYPVISMDDKITHKGSKRNLIGNTPAKELVEKFSLENQVTEETPITLLVHSADDKVVPVTNTESYANNLTSKGVNVTKIILPIGGHGYGFKTSEDVFYWTEYLAIWLNANILNK